MSETPVVDLPDVPGVLTGVSRQQVIDEHIAWLVNQQGPVEPEPQDFPLARWAQRNRRLVARTKAIGRPRQGSKSKAA